MEQVKYYELSQKEYVPILNEGKTSYGGRQQWFSDRLPKSKEARTHLYGCGVIAASDLFMYWAMTMPYKKEYSALRVLEKDGKLLKKNYMSFVEYVRDKYVYILPKVGVPNLELLLAVNRYMLFHQIPYKAQLSYLMDERKLLGQIIEMIKNDLPVIMLIGMPFPNVLYHTILKNREIGVPFYELQKKQAADQEALEEPVFKLRTNYVKGHYVVITGVIINKQAKEKKEKVMLKISSWGQEYYMSYYEYCKYEIKYGVDIQGSILYISQR